MTNTLPEPFTVNGRYEINERPLGEGGMGVIYKAYDVVTKRFVALKTIWADATPATIELFEREWTVLARLSHPNIVDILDTGDWVFNGQRRPYFVMPLLPGRTLEEIIKTSGERLSVSRTVDIISQACRGLQVAHDQNLIHRDIKPSNIFVMEDDTVKIIDFGVVHLSDGQNAGTSLKGTPLYMAPELLQMKPATPFSDIFALATVCYETLTGRKPFERPTATEIADAVRTYIPPAASEINPAVNQMVSRTVHKAMAKQAWHRFANAREFGDTLQKAFRNEPIERFERSKILPRIERVKKAYSEGDYEFALEILRELESEGHVDPDMAVLHIQIEQALRQKSIRQLLENARVRMEEEEFPLALHKVADVLAIDPNHADAQALKEQIERKRDQVQVAHWFRLVKEQLANKLYSQARQSLQELLKVDSGNTEAREMLATIDQREQEIAKTRDEKQRLYESAVESYKNGEVSGALSHLERALEMAQRNTPSTSPDLDVQCQNLYDSIRGERDNARGAYQQGRDFLAAGKVAQTIQICNDYLNKHPGDSMFQALRLEAEEAQREQQAAAVAEVSRRIDGEPDLDTKHRILQEAVDTYPAETHFRFALKLIADRRELVNAVLSRARQCEERGQFADAVSQMDVLRNIYPAFPGLDSEMQRLTHRKEEQAQGEAKSRWLEQIDSHLNSAEYGKALGVIPEALVAFPEDNDLAQRKVLAEQGVARTAEANVLVKEGQDFCAGRKFEDGLACLRTAERLDPRNRSARAALLSGLVGYARQLMPTDWHAAEPIVKEALDLEPTDPVVRSLLSVLDDNRKHTAINIILAGARNYQHDGHLSDALQIIERGLVQYPNDHRLIQFFNVLRGQTGQPGTAVTRPLAAAPVAEAGTAVAEATPPAEAPPPASETEPISVGPTSTAILLPGVSETTTPPDAVPKEVGEARPESSPTPMVVPQNLFAPPTTDIPPKQTTLPIPDKLLAESAGAASLAIAKLSPAQLQQTPRPLRRAATNFPAFQSALPPPSRRESRGFRGALWAVAALAALALIVAAGVFSLFHKSNPEILSSLTEPDARNKPAVSELTPNPLVRYPVSFESSVDGTRYTEGGQTLDATAQLTAGNHIVEAFHEGYLPESKSFTVDANAVTPLEVKFDLRAILPQLRFRSSIAHGKLTIDDAESLDLQGGVASKEDLSLGRHTVKIYDGRRKVFAFTFEATANEMPVLVNPLATQPIGGAVVSSLSGTAKLYTTADLRAAAALPVAPVPPTGLSLAGTAANPARFLLDTGKGHGPQEQSVDPSSFPTLTVQLAGAADGPSLLLTSNVAGCQVLVDGRPLKSPMLGKSTSIPVDPGTHPVRLSCPGYQDLEKVATVRAEDASPQKLDFVMLPVSGPAAPTTPVAAAVDHVPPAAPVHRALLTIAGAPPDAAVFQNQIRVGTVGADGTFSREIDPGTVTWEWRHAGYEPRKETRTVKAGDAIRLDGELSPASGSLLLKVTPESAHISVHRDSDNSSLSAQNNMPVSLTPGSYRITAQAFEYRERTETLVIASGKSVSLTWDLEKLPALSPPMRFFENGDSWQPLEEGSDFWVHSGSGYSSLRYSNGVFNIDFQRKKSHNRKINILADCDNHSNCIIYSLDGHNLTAKVIADGTTIHDERKAHGMDAKPSYDLVFEMSPDAIVVKNDAGAVLSTVERQNPKGKLSIQDGTALSIK